MAAGAVHHPLFARFYARVLSPHEPPEVHDNRAELLRGLTGTVVEVGAGAGANFGLYPPEVDEVIAVEPEAYLRDRAREAAAQAPVRVTVVDGVAEALPLGDAACDAAVACLVLCSVPDQDLALAELRRVLRPGGELRFYEHVRAPEPRMARLQHAVDRAFWPRAFGGCHTARDTVAAIARAGFAIESDRRLRLREIPRVVPVATHAIGVARK